MTASIRPAQLAKMLAYVLGREPDAFGLVPSAEGWVPLKDVLQVLSEEDGWRHVRRAHIDALVWERVPARVERTDTHIRAVDRRLAPPGPVQTVPKRLFTCVRRRAYARVREKGLRSPPPGIVMAAGADLARRIGRRRDPKPVLLEVHGGDLIRRGVAVQRFGELLFLADRLPPDCFAGPRLPKEKPAATAAPPPAAVPPHPGSFFPDLADSAAPSPPRRGKHQEPEWKRHRRRRRPPPER